MSLDDRPVKRADGRYDNVDFRKAIGYKFRPIKCAYNRRDVLLFVSSHGSASSSSRLLARFRWWGTEGGLGVIPD